MTKHGKSCYCHTCDKPFHYLGITRHRAMHKARKEDCVIEYTHGDTWRHLYAEKTDTTEKDDE